MTDDLNVDLDGFFGKETADQIRADAVPNADNPLSTPEDVEYGMFAEAREIEDKPDVDLVGFFGQETYDSMIAQDPVDNEGDGIMDRFEQNMQDNREYFSDVALQSVGALRDAAVQAIKFTNLVGSTLGEGIVTLPAQALGMSGEEVGRRFEETKEQADVVAEAVPEIEESERGHLRVGRKIATWVAHYVGLGKINSALAGGKTLGKTADAAEKLIRGVEADFTAFDEHEQRFFEILKDLDEEGSLQADVDDNMVKALGKKLAKSSLDTAFGDWMADRIDDSAWESKLKMAAEGVLFAAFGESVVGLSKTMYKGSKFIKENRKALDKAAVRQTETKTKLSDVTKLGREAQKLAKQIDEGKITPKQLSNLHKMADDLKGKRLSKSRIGSATKEVKEVIPIEERVALANKLGISRDDIVSGKVAKEIDESDAFLKMRASLNVKSEAANQTLDAINDIAARLDDGDRTALKDFDEVFASYAEVKKADDFIGSAQGRALGDRSHETEARAVDRFVKFIAGSSDELKEKHIKMLSDLGPEQYINLIDMAGKSVDSLIAKSSAATINRTKGAGKVLSQLEMYFASNLLASPVTLGLDTLGTATYLAYEKGANLGLAASIGGLRTLRGGNVADKVMFREAAAFWNSMAQSTYDGLRMLSRMRPETLGGKGVKRGAEDLAQSFKGLRADNAGRFGKLPKSDFLSPETIKGFNPMAQGIAKIGNAKVVYPFRYMQGKDDLVKASTFRAHKHQLATRKALGEGLTGDAYQARVKELNDLNVVDDIYNNMENLDNKAFSQYVEFAEANSVKNSEGVMMPNFKLADDALGMQKEAAVASRRLTFTQQSERMKKMNEFIDSIPASRLFLTFTTTLWNMTRIGIEDIFVGAPPALVKMLKGKGTAETDLLVARGLTAGSIIAGSAYLANDGLLVGTFPKDNAQLRTESLQMGIQERSITLPDGTNIGQLDRLLGPLSLFVFGPAEVVHAYKMNDDKADKKIEKDISDFFGELTAGLAKTMSNMTFVYTLSDLLSGIADGDQNKISQAMQNIGSALAVPNDLAFIMQQTNENLQAAKGLHERILSRLGYNVDPKFDMFGQPITRQDKFSFFLPLPMMEARDVPEWKQRLYESGAFPSVPSKTISVKRVTGINKAGELSTEKIADGIELDHHQYNDLMELIGTVKVNGLTWMEWVDQHVMTDNWDMLVDLERKPMGLDGVDLRTSTVRDAYSSYKNRATLELVKMHPELEERAKAVELRETSGPELSSFEKKRAAMFKNLKRDVPSLDGIQ